MRVQIFFALFVLIFGMTGCLAPAQRTAPGTMVETAKVDENQEIAGRIALQGSGSGWRLVHPAEEEAEVWLELSAGEAGEAVYRDSITADVSSTVNFKLQFLSTQGTGRFAIEGLDAKGNVIAGVGWVVTGTLPASTASMKWVDSRYSINFISSWIDTYYNVKVLFDKELENVNYDRIQRFQFRVETGNGQHALIARRDLFDDHSKSLFMEPKQRAFSVMKGEAVKVQAALVNRSKQVIDSAGVELVLPYGYGILPAGDMIRIAENLMPGERREFSWTVQANRDDAVNAGRPWPLVFKINGIAEETAPLTVSVRDPQEGTIYYVLTEDLEPSDGAGYEKAWGNQDGWLNPEEFVVQMARKAEKMNQIAETYGAKWTHYIAMPVLEAANWAEKQSPGRGWREAVDEVRNSMRKGSRNGHEYALHTHMDYDPYLPGNVLTYHEGFNGLWANHLRHGWANLLPEEGSYEVYESRTGSLYAYQRMLELFLGEDALGQSLSARAGSFDFGDGNEAEAASTRAYQRVGYFASSDADGNQQGYTSAAYGNEIYFAAADDINRKAMHPWENGLIEFRMTPEDFIAYEKETEQEWNRKVDLGMRYFMPNQKILPGVHAIVGFTHAFFLLGDHGWKSLDGGDFQRLDRHLEYVYRQYVTDRKLQFATASTLIEAYLEYYTPQPVAVYGKLLDQNFLSSCYEIKVLGKDIPASSDAPVAVSAAYPLSLRDTAYKIVIMKDGWPIQIENQLPKAEQRIVFPVDDKNAKYSMRIYHSSWVYRLLHENFFVLAESE